MGVLSAPSLNELEKLKVTQFVRYFLKCYCTNTYACRRRLPVVMVRMKMAQTLDEANRFVRQGRIFHL
jgi:ribosomal protein S4